MNTRYLLLGMCVVLFALLLCAAARADSLTSTELQQLTEQIGAAADEDLLGDLGDSTLLPPSTDHFARLYWDTRPGTSTRGSLAVGSPVSAQAGNKLLQLQSDEIVFVHTASVRRILNAAESWNARVASPNFADAIAEADNLVWTAAQADSVTSPDSSFIWSVLATRPALRDMFVASEISRDLPSYVPMRDPDDPAPGELWCYDLYKAKRVPEGILCYDSGTDCWWRRPCGPSAGGVQTLIPWP